MLTQITPENVEQVLDGELPVVLDFYTQSCGPCMKVSEIMHQLADEYEGRVVIGKVDCEENDDLVFEHRVMAVPTVLFFKNGKVAKRLTNLQTKDAYVAEIEKLL